MFDLIRTQIQQQSHTNRNLQFVDLGSGDGRVVFRAAREGVFHQSVGYEINPTLHLFAQARKLVSPKYWHTTRFQCRDLWKIQLRNYDVVAVYGLAPIMDRLGAKMREELKPGSIVVSNVFQIPGWKSVSNCKSENGTSLVGKGIYLYKVPECFGDVVTSEIKPNMMKP
jgi:SAM-dependent methyltransferase